MNHVPGSIHSPFATGLVPAGFDDLFPRTEDDANGNRDSAGYTVGTGGTLTASPNATYTYLCSVQAKSKKFNRNLSNHSADFSWRAAA